MEGSCFQPVEVPKPICNWTRPPVSSGQVRGHVAPSIVNRAELEAAGGSFGGCAPPHGAEEGVPRVQPGPVQAAWRIPTRRAKRDSAAGQGAPDRRVQLSCCAGLRHREIRSEVRRQTQMRTDKTWWECHQVSHGVFRCLLAAHWACRAAANTSAECAYRAWQSTRRLVYAMQFELGLQRHHAKNTLSAPIGGTSESTSGTRPLITSRTAPPTCGATRTSGPVCGGS